MPFAQINLVEKLGARLESATKNTYPVAGRRLGHKQGLWGPLRVVALWLNRRGTQTKTVQEKETGFQQSPSALLQVP